MYLDISELKEDIKHHVRLCGDSETECSDLQSECEELVNCIEELMKKVSSSDGSRISARSLDKYSAAQLKTFVCEMFEQLYSSKQTLRDFSTALVTCLDLLHELPSKTLSPLLKQSEHTVTINERFAKIDAFIAKESPALQQLESLCNEFKDHVSTLEGLKSDLSSQPPLHPPPPPVIDWTNIKFPPLPKVPVQQTTAIRNEVRLSHDVQLRKNNVILRGLPLSVQSDDPLTAAKSFLASCGIEQYKLCQKDLVSAFYLNRRDGHCTIRMIFSNQWIVEQILTLAYQLKSGKELYRGVYLAKDRTDDEMKTHRMLVTELKKKIEDHPTTRWVIRDGAILNMGSFSKSM